MGCNGIYKVSLSVLHRLKRFLARVVGFAIPGLLYSPDAPLLTYFWQLTCSDFHFPMDWWPIRRTSGILGLLIVCGWLGSSLSLPVPNALR
jgi:hypothetical protein